MVASTTHFCKLLLTSFFAILGALSREMPKCPECCVPLNPNDDKIQCDRCSKNFHYPCTQLESHIIKLHKKNPYKPWRCQKCVDKYCIHCDKTFPENYQDGICCDKCLQWYHPHCSGLTNAEFEHHTKNPLESWKCQKCIDRFCKKCDSNVFRKAKINCCLCKYTFHFLCANVPNSYKENEIFIKSLMCV